MVQHIVMWKMAEEAEGCTKAQNMEKVAALLTALPPKIQEIQSLAVHRNINMGEGFFDLVLVSSFASMDDLNAYQIHPEHKAVSAFVSKVRLERAAVDYVV